MTNTALIGFGAVFTAGTVLLAALWWRIEGAQRLARWRALRGRPTSAPEIRRALEKTARSAGRHLRPHSPLNPHRHADAPRTGPHGLPRLLFLGDGSAGLSPLLATVQPAGPIAPRGVQAPRDAAASASTNGASPASDSDSFWRWWRLPALVAIEVCPPPVDDTLQPDIGQWFDALRVLARAQPQRPLDGIAVCVSVAALQADAAIATPLFQLLARGVHSAASGLRQQLPVYVLVTQLQTLPGYDAMRGALPPPAAAHALGWRPAPAAPLSASAFDDALATIEHGLQRLRLGLLAQPRDGAARHGIHGFVEAALALRPGLRRLHDALRLQDGAAARWRGLYLTAADPDGAFVADLFQRFLPADGGLVE